MMTEFIDKIAELLDRKQISKNRQYSAIAMQFSWYEMKRMHKIGKISPSLERHTLTQLVFVLFMKCIVLGRTKINLSNFKLHTWFRFNNGLRLAEARILVRAVATMSYSVALEFQIDTSFIFAHEFFFFLKIFA